MINKIIEKYRERLVKIDPMPIVEIDPICVKASFAVLCMDCDAVFDWRRRNGICPACGSSVTYPLRIFIEGKRK